MYSAPTMKGTYGAGTTSGCARAEFIARRLSALKDHMLEKNLDLISARQLSTVNFSKILYLLKTWFHQDKIGG